MDAWTPKDRAKETAWEILVRECPDTNIKFRNMFQALLRQCETERTAIEESEHRVEALLKEVEGKMPGSWLDV